MKINGTWTALVTPFNPDYTVDWDGLRKLVEFQVEQGISGIVPVGTTGESPTLDWEEHNSVIGDVIEHAQGKCGILAGTGSNSTSEAIESTRHAVEAGADAALMVDCYYNGPSSQELRDEYYSMVAAEFPEVEIVPYIIPGRSGTALAVEDLAILADRYKNISTVKEATGDLDRMAKTRKLLGSEFSIMSGDDDLTCKMMTDSAIKADGVISVVTNVVPGAVKKMVDAAAAGDVAKAEKMRDALAPLLGVVTVKVDNKRVLPNGETAIVNDRYRNPLAIKTLMAGIGMPAGLCRKPLGRMSKAGVAVVRDAVKQVWEKNPEVLAPIGEFFAIDIEARLDDDVIWDFLAL